MSDIDLKDKLLQDELRIRGPQQDSKILERMKQDQAVQAAIVIERERQAAALRRSEALAIEAQERGAAEVNAVAQLYALAPLYEQRQEAARQVIEAVSALWKVESEIRNGLQLADRTVSSVEAYIDVTMRGAWRQSLRDRAGLPARHIFNAPKQWITTEAQKVGAAAVAGITASIIGPNFVQVGRDVINFE